MRSSVRILLLLVSILTSPLTLNAQEIKNITVTAYSYEGQKRITASGKIVCVGHIALSRDLEKKYKIKFGDQIIVKGIGTYEFQDRMPFQKNMCDIYFASKKEAILFGKKHNRIIQIVRKNQSK